MTKISPLARLSRVGLMLAVLLVGCRAETPPAAPPTEAAPIPTRAALPTTTPAPTQAAAIFTATPTAVPAAIQPIPAVLPAVASPTPFVPDQTIDEASLGRLELLRTIGYGSVTDAAVAPDAGLLAVGSEAGIAFFDLASLQALRFQPLPGGVSAIDLSPDGLSLAAVGQQTLLVRLPGFETVATITGHTPRFSPDGRYLATQEGESRYWHDKLDQTSTLIWRVSDGVALATVPGYAAAFSPDGASIATSDGAGFQLSRLPDGAPIVRHAVAVQHDPRHQYARHEGYVKDLAFAADGGTLLVALGGEVQEWDAAAGLLRTVDLPSGGNLAARVDFLAPGGAAAGVSMMIPGVPVPSRLVAIAGGATLYQPDSGNWNSTMAFSADGSTALQWAPWFDQALRVIDVAQGKVRGAIDLPAFSQLAISPDGDLLAAAAQSHTYLWNFTDPSFQRLLDNELPDILRFSPDSQRLLSAGSDHRVLYGDPPLRLKEWSLGDGGLVMSDKTLRPQLWLDLSPTGALLVRIGLTAQLTLTDGDSEVILPLDEAGRGTAGAVSQDGALAAVGTDAGLIRLFDAASGARVADLTLKDKAQQLAFSPDNAYLAAQDATGELTVWPIGSGAAPPSALWSVSSPLASKLLISADNQLLIAAGERSLTFYRLSDGQALRTLDVAAEGVALGPYRHIMTILSGGQIQVWGIKP